MTWMVRRAVVVLAVLFGAAGAYAQSSDQVQVPAVNDGKAKADEVKKLEERVGELEKKLQDKQAEPKPAPSSGSVDLSFKWSEGLKLESADKKWKFHLGGRVQSDWAWITEDDDVRTARTDQEDGHLFRRARLTWSGDIYERFFFNFEVEFTADPVEFRDMGVGVKKPWGSGWVKVGHYKEPFSLEELTSSVSISFMERSLPVTTFAAAHNPGFLAGDMFWDDRITVTFGVFRDAPQTGIRLNEGEWAIAARITALVVDQEKDGGFLVHTGLAVRLHSPPGDTIAFSTRPEIRHADNFISTGNFESTRDTRIGLEAAFTYGPFSAQAEYMMADQDSDPADDPGFSGYYLFGSYFVTGERRPYDRPNGRFGRVKPKKNAFDGDGFGAIEVLLRYSQSSIDDGTFSGDGREVTDITAAANWYLNPNVKVQLNLILADLDGIGDARILGMRFQVDF